jgi:predicted DNA-binding mobile mystery protein A
MKNQWVMIKQLDRQFKNWQEISRQYKRPKPGWVKTLRVALNMTGTQLANRIGVKGGRIHQLEQAEAHGVVTLQTLEKVAEALDCELIYAIIPKNGLTLEDIIKNKAEQIANEKINMIAHTMSLEAQSLNKELLAEQKNELAKQLAEQISKSLWAEK